MVLPTASLRARPCGLQDHPSNEHAAVWWFAAAPRGCPVTLQGGLSLGLDDFPVTKAAARSLVERFQGRQQAQNKEHVAAVVQTLKELQHHLELVDRPSVTDSVAGPLLCALTLGATKARRSKAVRLKQRRYEQIIKHYSTELAAFGFCAEICWNLQAPTELDIYGYELDDHWQSPSIVFKPAKAPRSRRFMTTAGALLDPTGSHHSASSTASNTSRAWEFVETVLLLQNRLHKRDPEAYKQVRVIKSDDLFFFSKRFLDQQELYQTDSSASCTVDIGYHYTQQDNLAKIKTGGLLSRADLEASKIAAITNGSSFGDGIYTADNPFAYHDMHYGDAGILVARLGGTIKVTEDIDGADYPQPFDHDSLRVLRCDARVNMTILRKSSQCLALAYYDGSILDKTDASAPLNRAINKFHLELQLIVDKFMNGGRRTEVILEAPFRTVIAMPVKSKKSSSKKNAIAIVNTKNNHSNGNPPPPSSPPTHIITPNKSRSKPSGDTTTTGKGPAYVKALIRYEAPETLDGCDLEDGINVGAWNEGVTGDSCPVCFLSFVDEIQDVATVNHCGHTFHESCLRQAISFMGTRCPICRVVINEPVGKMPSGTMRIAVDPNMTCAGFPKGTIVITYSIPSGVQMVYHMNPGETYSATERHAFLPLLQEGLELLVRLKYAFRHGLTFDVGTSLTTGKHNVVIWSSIHHKTSLSGGAHGWPDPAYFLNCNEELDALGVPQPEELEEII